MKFSVAIFLGAALYATATADQGHHDRGQYSQGAYGSDYFDSARYGGHDCYGVEKKRVSYDYQHRFRYSHGGDYSYGYYKRYCRTGGFYRGDYKDGQCANYNYGQEHGYDQGHGYDDDRYGYDNRHGYGGGDGYGGGFGLNLFGFGLGFGRGDKCYPLRCDLYASYGWSRCHGKVRLSHSYYYYGHECRTPGFSCGRGGGYGGGYGGLNLFGGLFGYGHGGYGGGCECQTYTCAKSVKACYRHHGRYYEDTVYIQIPCGCHCSRRKSHYYY